MDSNKTSKRKYALNKILELTKHVYPEKSRLLQEAGSQPPPFSTLYVYQLEVSRTYRSSGFGPSTSMTHLLFTNEEAAYQHFLKLVDEHLGNQMGTVFFLYSHPTYDKLKAKGKLKKAAEFISQHYSSIRYELTTVPVVT